MKTTKKELGEELLNNMDLTKEQYIALCKLCDELGLEKVESNQDEDGKA